MSETTSSISVSDDFDVLEKKRVLCCVRFRKKSTSLVVTQNLEVQKKKKEDKSENHMQKYSKATF